MVAGSIFTEVWDANSVLQLHKYWSPPDRPSIQRFIDVGTRLGLPIYMGEGGENTPAWLQTAFQLYEVCGIGWNFWPWKKIDTANSPYSIDPPDGWLDVIAYAAGKEPRPSDTPLWKLLDNMDIARCSYRLEVVNAIMRRPRRGGRTWGSADTTFAILWNQHRCSRVVGNTSRSADQNPSAPSPTARTGARRPRRLQSRTSPPTTRPSGRQRSRIRRWPDPG
jgi:hypothetical protein